jgi:hypothetical protein
MRVLASLLLIGLIPAGLAACAEPGEVASMTYGVVASTQVAARPELANSTAVGTVIGGEETDPLWTPRVDAPSFQEALTQSLEENDLLSSDPAAARYRVEANIYELRQPYVHLGIDHDATAIVQYRVYHADGSKELWFSRDVHSTGSAGFGDAWLGVEQRQIAVERAMASNIQQFIDYFIQQQ